MACESDKCEKYGMHHEYKNGVEIRKCQFCKCDDQPERSKREDFDLEYLEDEFLKEFWERKDAKVLIPHGEAETYFLTGISLFRIWLNQRCGALNTTETS
jgi:hypothetical protein